MKYKMLAALAESIFILRQKADVLAVKAVGFCGKESGINKSRFLPFRCIVRPVRSETACGHPALK